MVFTSYSEVFTYCKLILFDEDLLECVDAVLLIENQHGFLPTNSLDSQECNPKKTERLRSNVRKDSANTGRSRRHQSEWVQAYYRIACAARCHP